MPFSKKKKTILDVFMMLSFHSLELAISVPKDWQNNLSTLLQLGELNLWWNQAAIPSLPPPLSLMVKINQHAQLILFHPASLPPTHLILRSHKNTWICSCMNMMKARFCDAWFIVCCYDCIYVYIVLCARGVCSTVLSHSCLCYQLVLPS